MHTTQMTGTPLAGTTMLTLSDAASIGMRRPSPGKLIAYRSRQQGLKVFTRDPNGFNWTYGPASSLGLSSHAQS